MLFRSIPAIAEIVPGVVGAPWFGVSAPAKTPPAVLERLERELLRVLRSADVRSRLEALGMEPGGAGSAEFVEHIHAENQLWGPIIRQLNVKIE